MARFLSQTLNLIRTTAFTSAAKTRGIHRLYAQPESPLTKEPTISEAEAKAWAWDVEALEDSMYSKILINCKPDWVPFVPGASYWVPPRTSCGVSELARSLAKYVYIKENLAPFMINVTLRHLAKECCEDWADIPVFFVPDSTSHVGYKTYCLLDWEDPDFRFVGDDDTHYFENVPEDMNYLFPKEPDYWQ